MKLFLIENIQIELSDVQLHHPPRILLDCRKVIVSSANRFDFQKEKGKSTGSLEAWLDFEDFDEIGFDKTTKNLRFVNFKYPEKEKIIDTERLSLIPTFNNGIRLLSENDFILRPFLYRHYSAEHSRLFAFSENFLDANSVEVAISDCVSFYFDNEIFNGWSVKNPETFLSDFSWDFTNEEIDGELKNNFSELLRLTEEENIERMDDGDEMLREELKKLYTTTRMHSNKGSRCSKIMAEWILNLADVFYENEKNNYFLK